MQDTCILNINETVPTKPGLLVSTCFSQTFCSPIPNVHYYLFSLLLILTQVHNPPRCQQAAQLQARVLCAGMRTMWPTQSSVFVTRCTTRKERPRTKRGRSAEAKVLICYNFETGRRNNTFRISITKVGRQESNTNHGHFMA